MTTASRARAWWRLSCCIAACTAIPLAGCDDDPVRTPVQSPGPGVREVWLGTYADRNDPEHGALVLDATVTGTNAVGRVVLRSRVARDPDIVIVLRGTTSADSVLLTPDPALYSPGVRLSLRAARTASHLTGTLTFANFTLDALVDAAPLQVDSLEVLSSFVVERGVHGLAFDGAYLWASTLESYHRYALDGRFFDEVHVFYQPTLLWTSDALTSDGSRLWGHLPTAVDSAGTVYSRSTLLEFSLDGVITRRSDVRHRISGLAHDGTSLWSLPIDSSALVRLDESGVALERITVAAPDLADIASDGQHVWATGWFSSFLYEMDAQGAILRAFDLPSEPGTVPTGLTFDGEALWYASSGLGGPSTLYRVRPTPP